MSRGQVVSMGVYIETLQLEETVSLLPAVNIVITQVPRVGGMCIHVFEFTITAFEKIGPKQDLLKNI